MAKVIALVKPELPSIYCGKCRRWVESQEKINLFATVDGAKKKVLVWLCPECRGEMPPGTVVEAREVTQADVSRDERLGPYRPVVAGTAVLNPGGKTARAKLACGHEACVLPDAKKARCRKCKTEDSSKPRRGKGATA